MPFAHPHLSRLQPALAKKINEYHDNHENFKVALLNNHQWLLLEVLEKGYPCVAHNFFSQEEIYEMGDSLSDDLDDIFHPEVRNAVEHLCLLPHAQEALNTVAPYIVFKKESCHLIDIYLAHTTNYEQALQFAKTFYGNMQYQHDTAYTWLKGAMFNESHEFFKEIYSLHQGIRKPLSCSNDILKTSLSLSKILEKKHLNFSSWQEYFYSTLDLCVDNLLADKSSIFHQLSEEDALYHVLNISSMNAFNTVKKDKNCEVAQQICQVIFQELKQFVDVTNVQETALFLAYKGWSLESFISINRPRSKRSFSNLSNFTLKKTTEELESQITELMNSHDAKQAYDILQRLEIPSSLYPRLEEYATLENKLPPNSIHAKVKKL